MHDHRSPHSGPGLVSVNGPDIDDVLLRQTKALKNKYKKALSAPFCILSFKLQLLHMPVQRATASFSAESSSSC